VLLTPLLVFNAGFVHSISQKATRLLWHVFANFAKRSLPQYIIPTQFRIIICVKVSSLGPCLLSDST
jgi:hypothetical protein